MVGSGPHQEESMGSRWQDDFLNLERKRIEKVAHTPLILVKVILGLGVMSLKGRMKEPCKGRLTI